MSVIMPIALGILMISVISMPLSFNRPSGLID
jgi:hypothetical protein